MKKRKTVLVALFCPLMLTGMISTAFISMFDTNVVNVEASEITETTIAKIGTEGYESLEDAINAVQNNETIVVIKDFTYDTPISINNGKTFSIDFKDGSTQHTFRWYDMMGSQTDKNIFTIDDNSNVTVKNLRYLVGMGEKANRVFNVNSTATLTLTNMICSSDDEIKDIPVRNNGGTVVIDGGDITTYAPGGADLLSPVVQNLNNGTTTITGNGTFTMKNTSTGVAWLGNIVTTAGASTDVDRENSCGTVIIENGTFSNGHIVDVNGKGTVIINDGTLTTGIGPAIKTFHGGVKSNITVNNVTTSTMVFAQVLEELNTKIDFQNGNVKFTKFCMNLSGNTMDSISIANGKFGPKSGTTDIRDAIEGFLADGAVISALIDDPNGYTYKVETPHAHTYGTVSATWDGDQVTLTTSCSCGDEQTQTFTGTYTKVSDATCTAKETGKYVATIAEGIFAGTYESNVFEVGNPLGHHTTLVNGQSPTCTEDGYKDAYYCDDCGMYFENADGTGLIGNETAYNDWILGDGKISASGHSMTHHTAVAPTCTEDGTVEYWTCSHESGIYYADEQGNSTLTSIVDPKLGHDIIHHDTKAPTCTEAGWEAYDTCSRCDYSIYVEIPALDHSLSEVAGKTPTCTEDGYMVAYKCSTCEMYFTDPAGEHKIGNETAYNAWKLNEGKIQARHVVSKVSGVDPTKEKSGYKEAWKCSECGQYFEDEACTVLIGDETAYNVWKSARGYLPQLPSEGLSAGAIVGICVVSIFLFLLVIYLIGYFFLYRKGKLDEKKIKVIYKFLPRGKRNLKENEK